VKNLKENRRHQADCLRVECKKSIYQVVQEKFCVHGMANHAQKNARMIYQAHPPSPPPSLSTYKMGGKKKKDEIYAGNVE
jgi:hypothetical protein